MLEETVRVCFVAFMLVLIATAIPADASPTRTRSSIPVVADDDVVTEARAVVVAALVSAGMSPDDAAARVKHFDDHEICGFAMNVDQLRAAGGLNRWQITAIVVGGIVVTILTAMVFAG